ncbi:MAG: putative HTH-type transcriptional regulator YtcD [Candidatus Heimdallarchaeota archaeon LC_3]|nr:MAG: putative HTH-type transcriptional regulator YtcD [Candidatus Heimdallarchaeota archaeon LC_3]
MVESGLKMPMIECILAKGIKILSKKWTPHIFCHLLDHEVLTFTELQNSIKKQFKEGITGSVLSETLKLLEKHRLIKKRVITDYIPAKTEYNLTKKGKELRIIYGFIKKWALKWINEEQLEGLEATYVALLR